MRVFAQFMGLGPTWNRVNFSESDPAGPTKLKFCKFPVPAELVPCSVIKILCSIRAGNSLEKPL